MKHIMSYRIYRINICVAPISKEQQSDAVHYVAFSQTLRFVNKEKENLSSLCTIFATQRVFQIHFYLLSPCF